VTGRHPSAVWWEAEGAFVTHSSRVLIEARKP
jgi:hypothetical protein